MNFSDALQALKDGQRVQRQGWNGKDMWIELIKPDDEVLSSTYIYQGEEIGVDPCIAMKTAQGTLQPGWLASQADLLADDWQIVFS